MAKTKITADQFEATLQKALAKYADDLRGNLGNISKEFAQKGAKQVSQASGRFRNTGAGYAQGWTSRYETSRYSAQGIIYNKDVPGLPHLLENPHAKRGGGRTSGNPHIAPVEEEICKEFEKAVKGAI